MMNKDSGFLRNIIISFPMLLICVGLYCILQSTFGEFEVNSKYKIILSIFGNAIFTGALFAAILKYMQFMKIFKDELIDIIYETDYLEKRKDLEVIWERVSKVLFNNKFPKISQNILDDVKKMYFPIDHVEYYDNYDQTIEIELIDAVEQKIKVTQTSIYTAYPKHKNESIPHKSTNNIKFNKDKNEVSFKILKYKVNGDIMEPTIQQNVEGNSLNTIYTVNLVNIRNEYKFETVVEKIYSLKYDCIIGQTKDYIINNFKVLIHLKGNLSIDFLSFGTINKFQKTSRINDNNYNQYEYKGLIYPKQGYLIFVKVGY